MLYFDRLLNVTTVALRRHFNFFVAYATFSRKLVEDDLLRWNEVVKPPLG